MQIGEPVIITHRGEDCLKLIPINYYEKKPASSEAFKEGLKKASFDTFSCGCAKVEGKYLCPVHGRV